MTEYREKHDGYCGWLQYRVKVTILGLVIPLWWNHVKRPYYHSVRGRDCILMYDTHINTNNTNLDEFIKRYPNIKGYKYEYEIQQRQREKYVMKKRRERDTRRGITKLN